MSDFQPADSVPGSASSPGGVTEPALGPASGDAVRASGDAAGSAGGRTLAEWLTFLVATLILVLLVLLVLLDWRVNQNRPPAFRVETAPAVQLTTDQYHLPFTVINTGGRIARAVQVQAQLQVPGAADESGEQQIDFLSGNEQKHGSFVFSHDPQAGQLIIRVASYGLP